MILHRWISVGSDLKFDARRDLDDVGAACVEGIFLENYIQTRLYLLLMLCFDEPVCLLS